MSTLVSKDSKEITFSMFVELINMELRLSLRHFNRKRRLKRFVISIMGYIRMCMSGLILALIILGGRVLSGMRKFVSKFS